MSIYVVKYMAPKEMVVSAESAEAAGERFAKIFGARPISIHPLDPEGIILLTAEKRNP